MKSSKGQALVEFVLIVPVLIFVILAIIDISNIVINKYKLEDHISTIIDLYQNNKTDDINVYCLNNGLGINYTHVGNYTTIRLEKHVNVMTPGLNNIIGKQMIIDTERTIYNE